MFPKIDALPDSQSRASIDNRKAHVHVGQDGTDMGGHVVRSLLGMIEYPVPIRYQT